MSAVTLDPSEKGESDGRLSEKEVPKDSKKALKGDRSRGLDRGSNQVRED